MLMPQKSEHKVTIGLPKLVKGCVNDTRREQKREIRRLLLHEKFAGELSNPTLHCLVPRSFKRIVMVSGDHGWTYNHKGASPIS